MKSFTDAKSAAEKAGTERTQKFRPKLWAGIAGATMLVAAIWATLVYQDHRGEEGVAEAAQAAIVTRQATAAPVRAVVPLVTSDPSSWPQVVIPANGRSGYILLPIEMHHIVVKGTGSAFRLHSVYADGKDCAFGNSCPDGNVTGNYIVDESGADNKVSYAFVPIGR
jgi:hypothetical protein